MPDAGPEARERVWVLLHIAPMFMDRAYYPERYIAHQGAKSLTRIAGKDGLTLDPDSVREIFRVEVGYDPNPDPATDELLLRPVDQLPKDTPVVYIRIRFEGWADRG